MLEAICFWELVRPEASTIQSRFWNTSSPKGSSSVVGGKTSVILKRQWGFNAYRTTLRKKGSVAWCSMILALSFEDGVAAILSSIWSVFLKGMILVLRIGASLS